MVCDADYTVTALVGDWDAFPMPKGHVVGSNLWQVFDPVKYADLVALYERVMETGVAETLAFADIEANRYGRLHVRSSPKGFVLFVEDFSEEVRGAAEDRRKTRERGSESASTNDPLLTDTGTKLPNRAGIELKLEQTFERAMRGQTSFSVLLINVDEFENLNETLGRDVGDQVLISLGAEIRKASRATDFLGRFACGKLVLILQDVGIGQACRIGMRICTTTPTSLDMPLQVNVSIGVAGYCYTDRSWHIILKRAFYALTQAERGQGSKICAITDDIHRAEEYFDDLPSPCSCESRLNG